MDKLIVSVSRESCQYPIIIDSNIYKNLPDYLLEIGINTKNKIMIITDSNVAPLYLDIVKDTLIDFNVTNYIVPAGEKSKSLNEVNKIVEFAIKEGLDRSSVIIALGGGVVGDLAGFIAAVYMRGITFVQCPTTILAHDSSVGGKVAVNHLLGKNLIGAFYQPKLVLYNTQFLKSLPLRQIKSGFAEVIKHSLISNEDFSKWLSTNAKTLLNLDLEYVNKALYEGIEVKKEIVNKDEKEIGIRALLNYGHTLAHAIEIISDFTFTHGEAVGIGMVFASDLAYELGVTSYEVALFTRNIVEKFELPISIPQEFSADEILNIMMRDKKFVNNQIKMILPTNIGEVIIKNNIDKKVLVTQIEKLKR